MSVTAIDYALRMGRWASDGGDRLAQAAMELYAERGFEATTVAEIAARAGLTERTFFRHYTDKREVVFAGSEVLQERMVSAVAAAPASASPLDAATAGVLAGAEMLQDRRPLSIARQRVIDATPELQERELIKFASIADAFTAALRERGVADPAAGLTAEVALAVFRIGFERWIAEPAKDAVLAEAIHAALGELPALTATPAT